MKDLSRTILSHRWVFAGAVRSLYKYLYVSYINNYNICISWENVVDYKYTWHLKYTKYTTFTQGRHLQSTLTEARDLDCLILLVSASQICLQCGNAWNVKYSQIPWMHCFAFNLLLGLSIIHNLPVCLSADTATVFVDTGVAEGSAGNLPHLFHRLESVIFLLMLCTVQCPSLSFFVCHAMEGFAPCEIFIQRTTRFSATGKERYRKGCNGVNVETIVSYCKWNECSVQIKLWCHLNSCLLCFPLGCIQQTSAVCSCSHDAVAKFGSYHIMYIYLFILPLFKK